MQPASTALLRVASSSFAVIKMTGHFDPDDDADQRRDHAAVADADREEERREPRRADGCPGQVDVEQQAGCRMRAAAAEQSRPTLLLG